MCSHNRFNLYGQHRQAEDTSREPRSRKLGNGVGTIVVERTDALLPWGWGTKVLEHRCSNMQRYSRSDRYVRFLHPYPVLLINSASIGLESER
jgi:hypothetical protein